MTHEVAQIWRHPIKAIGAEPLTEVRLNAGGPLPLDRAWALLTGTSTDTGGWQHCRNFARGCYGPELMGVTAATNNGLITLNHPKQDAITIDPTTDSAKLVDWINAIYPAERSAPHTLIKSPDGGMADVETSAISLMSLSSLNALGEKLGQTLDPRRFRGNLWIDGDTPFEEFDWIDRELQIGDVRLKVIDRITRCRATEANPETGERDANTLKALREHWGHTDFGILAVVQNDGDVAVGDTLKVL